MPYNLKSGVQCYNGDGGCIFSNFILVTSKIQIYIKTDMIICHVTFVFDGSGTLGKGIVSTKAITSSSWRPSRDIQLRLDAAGYSIPLSTGY